MFVGSLKHIHSGTAPVDLSFPDTPLFNLGDPRYAGRVNETPAPVVTYPAMFPTGTPFTPPADPALRVPGEIDTRTTGFGGSAGIIEIFYHFVVRDGDDSFTFAWVNSAGTGQGGNRHRHPRPHHSGAVPGSREQRPADRAGRGDRQRPLLDHGQSAQDGRASGLDRQPRAANNQQRDIIMCIEHLGPRIYYPGHLTDVAQAGSGLYHKINWRQTALNMGFPESAWPEFRLQIDPNDFLVPQVFDIEAERWTKSHDEKRRIRSMCRSGRDS